MRKYLLGPRRCEFCRDGCFWLRKPSSSRQIGREGDTEIHTLASFNFLSDLLARVFMSQAHWTVKDKEDIDRVYVDQAFKAESRMESRFEGTDGR